jgi:hypothetical protein
MTILELLTMAEFEELNALNGDRFENVYKNGLPLGRPAAALAWLLDRRTNPTAKIETYMAMSVTEVKKVIEGHTDPKD